MWLIVGLGNPGLKYRRTRHNIGFRLIDSLAKELGISVRQKQCSALIGHGELFGEKVVLAKPQTYMNLSGVSVKCLIEHYGVEPSQVLVVYDDMDLSVGRIRIRAKGSHGGHKGMKSVIEQLRTSCLPRLRIGIGRSDLDELVVDYVLGTFSKEEELEISQVLVKACEAVQVIIKEGLESAMNKYNQR